MSYLSLRLRYDPRIYGHLIKSPVFYRVFVLLEFRRAKRSNFLKAQIVRRFAMTWLEEYRILMYFGCGQNGHQIETCRSRAGYIYLYTYTYIFIQLYIYISIYLYLYTYISWQLILHIKAHKINNMLVHQHHIISKTNI